MLKVWKKIKHLGWRFRRNSLTQENPKQTNCLMKCAKRARYQVESNDRRRLRRRLRKSKSTTRLSNLIPSIQLPKCKRRQRNPMPLFLVMVNQRMMQLRQYLVAQQLSMLTHPTDDRVPLFNPLWCRLKKKWALACLVHILPAPQLSEFHRINRQIANILCQFQRIQIHYSWLDWIR